jgi:hypothetical protein
MLFVIQHVFNDFEQITLGSFDDSPLEPLIIDLAEIHLLLIIV